MRRQVKPFVTEYRGSPRRNKDLHSGDPQQDLQAPRNRSYAEAEKIFHSEAHDDSYEAALRAADALFDASTRKSEPAAGVAAANRPEQRKILQAATPIPKLSDQLARGVFADQNLGLMAGEEGERDVAFPPRRILQAIEPQTEDRFAALEVERAPKRRGRKPGSKNKPKIIVGDDWGTSKPASATMPIFQVVVPITPPPVRDFVPVLATQTPAGGLELVEDELTLPQPRGRKGKFGWKRAVLLPGERWKRRLPKVAW